MFEALFSILTVFLAGGLVGIFSVVGIIVALAFAVKGTISLIKWIFGIKPKNKN